VRADTIDVAVSIYASAACPPRSRVPAGAPRPTPEAPLVISMPHPAFRIVTRGQPTVLRRSYFDHTPIPWVVGTETGTDHPLTISDLFPAEPRNFRVDNVLDRAVEGVAARPALDRGNAMGPSTLIVRARKQGI